MMLCNKNDCIGCAACFVVCKENAITLIRDDEHFLYPVIDNNYCRKCKKCSSVCPILKKDYKNTFKKIVYAAYSNDLTVRLQSSSGGIFSEFAEYVLAQKGVVFGAVFSSDYRKVFHTFVETQADLQKLRGSKYVQSEIGETYTLCRDFLKQGRCVLFSGTPCQIAGLNAFLSSDDSVDLTRLLTIDLVCHGVPSPLIFKSYIEYLEKKMNGKIEGYAFRDKHWSWQRYNTKAYLCVVSSDGKDSTHGVEYLGKWEQDVFMRGFLREYFLRKCCHNCKFANLNRCSDITLADFWGYKSRKELPDDDKGISMVMLNTEKAKFFFEKIKQCISFLQTPISEAVNGNRALSSCFPVSPYREQFWNGFKQFGFEGIIEKYLYPEKADMYWQLIYKYGRNSLNFRSYSFYRKCRSFAGRCFRFARNKVMNK